jgi:hypothetical protein
LDVATNTIPAGSVNVTTGRAFTALSGSRRSLGPIVGVYTLNSFSIPAITGSARHHDAAVGTICEVIIVAGTDTRIAQLVEGYLAWKWPTLTALNEDHPFVNRPPEIGQ